MISPLKSLLPKIKIILIFINLFIICQVYAENLKTGDLIFHISGNSLFSQAISSATSIPDSIDFDHVGIIELIEEKAYIIEASPEAGVRKISLEKFLNENSGKKDSPTFIVKRLKKPIDFNKAIKLAYSHIGEDYDWWYLPENGKMYCSELVYECYLDSEGNKIFDATPMNFRAKDGTMPEFWKSLFDQINAPIPEGLPGTNPNDLSRSPLLRTVDYF